jgi:prevent-host-death family protein
MTTSITTANAKQEFTELINRVAHNKERIILTRRGQGVAVIVPMEDLSLLQDSENKNDLDEAIEALKEARKNTISLEKLKEELGGSK